MATVLNPNATEDEPLRINLDEEAAADGAAVAPTATPPPAAAEKPAPAPAAGIDELKRQLDETARNRQLWVQHARQKEQEAQQQAAIAQQAQERGILAEEVVNETRLNSVNEQMKALEEAQATAFEAGEFKKVAEINAKMNRCGGQIAVLEQQKQWLESNRQQYLANQQYQQQQRQAAAQQAAAAPAAPTDPFERALAGRTARTQEFLRAHRDLVRPDGTLKRAAIEAHERALDEGLRVDTEDYFRKVEEFLGSDAPRERAIKNTAARPKGAPTTAAPVSRGGSIPGHQGGGEYVMSPKMRERAREQLGDGNEAEWFKAYVESVKAGRMEPYDD